MKVTTNLQGGMDCAHILGWIRSTRQINMVPMRWSILLMRCHTSFCVMQNSKSHARSILDVYFLCNLAHFLRFCSKFICHFLKKLNCFLFKDYCLSSQSQVCVLGIFYFIKVMLFLYFGLKFFSLLERWCFMTNAYVCG